MEFTHGPAYPHCPEKPNRDAPFWPRFAVSPSRGTNPLRNDASFAASGWPRSIKVIFKKRAETASHKIICSKLSMRARVALRRRCGRLNKLIPRRDARSLPNFHLTDAQWEDLALPIDLAFLVYSTPAKKMMAFHFRSFCRRDRIASARCPPGISLVADNPALDPHASPTSESSLVNRVGERRLYYLAPIDVCFELVGLMRTHWRGLSGGEEVWREIDAFFARP